MTSLLNSYLTDSSELGYYLAKNFIALSIAVHWMWIGLVTCGLLLWAYLSSVMKDAPSCGPKPAGVCSLQEPVSFLETSEMEKRMSVQAMLV